MKNSLKYLNYLFSQAQTEANETYEQALENCFKYYLTQEYDADTDIDEAKADFEKSTYYFLEVKDFEKQKYEKLNSLKLKAQTELVNLIDILDIENLRELKKIYNQIVKIIDSNQVDYNNDCKLVY